MEGFLLVDKPPNWTSFDVVKYVRSKAAKVTGLSPKSIKVGHSGTLDPFATGLMILLIGKNYTVRANALLKQDKIYEVLMELDQSSTTGDPEGVIEPVNTPLTPPDKDDIEKVLKSFIGRTNQTPPAFSAVKVNGVRAYKLARDNKPVKLEPRTITIKSLDLLSYEYPFIKLRSDVSSGTYIRSLVEDIGKSLDRKSYTKELRRTSIGGCSLNDAFKIEQITEQSIERLLRAEL